MKFSFSYAKKILLGTFLLGSLCAYAELQAGPTPEPYPLTTCVVSGDKLGCMEEPTIIDYQGTEVRFCCKDCTKDFQKDPEKYLKKLQEAAASKVKTDS